MTAARLLAPALALVAALLSGAVPAPAAADTGGPTPLSVHIDRLSRATLPRHGRLVVTGTVSNDSGETWRGVIVQPLTSYEPITSRAGLASAAASPADTFVGARLTAPHTYDQIGDLNPGESARFRLSLPARALTISGSPGVYWFGVHALGTNAQGRDNFADGRARTFLPLMPSRGSELTQTELVLPLRAEVRRDPSGALLNAPVWSTDLAPGGLLERELRFAESAHDLPLTWLVDPAVLQAADDIAHGNPPLSYGEPVTGTTTPSPSPTPNSPSPSSPSPSATGTPSPPAAQTNTDAGLPVKDREAADWLARARAAMGGQSVLGLPYADPDVAALARKGPRLLDRARVLADATFHSYGIEDVPAVAPVDGLLPDRALNRVRPNALLLLSDQGSRLRHSQWVTRAGQGLVFTDARAAAGGPSPTPPFDALALRQRIVADSALRALHHDSGPMVVVLPQGWDPGTAWQRAGFFTGLARVPWLQLASVGPNPSAPTYRQGLVYPHSALRRQIDRPNVRAARRLVNSGKTLASVLATSNDVIPRVTGAALAAVSYQARGSERVARQQVKSFTQNIHRTLAGISVNGTDFVTLSGSSGSLTVSLVNALNVPVTVGIAARSDSPQVSIETPKPVQVAAGQRTTLRLNARSSAIGVHRITLTAVSQDGHAVGTPLVFSMRTSELGRWIWVVLASGGALLVFAITRRVVLRLRPRRHA